MVTVARHVKIFLNCKLKSGQDGKFYVTLIFL